VKRFSPYSRHLVALKYPAGRGPAQIQPPYQRPSALLSPLLPFQIPSSQQPGSHLPHQQAMELFPDGGFVRLQNRANRRYVHADEDWVGVSLRPNGPVPSLNAVWRVEHWVSPLWPNDGDTFVLLQNAAYGRYLSSSMDEAPHGHLGQRATQHNRDDPQVLDIHPPWIWSVERLHAPDDDYVRLRHYAHNLRANGRYKIWNIGVTVDYNLQYPASSTMIQWAVHAVEASPSPQPLPLTLQHQVHGFTLYPSLHCVGMQNSPRSATFTWATNHGCVGFDFRLHKILIAASKSLRLSLPKSETIRFFRCKTTEPVNSS
jgi:hypothetical protein